MSDLVYLTDADLAADVELEETVALEVFWTNPQAVRDLIYGPTRAIIGAAPAHDHDEDGGESLLLPILSHSWGTYTSNPDGVGILLGYPETGTFAPVTTNGVVDKSTAKRLYCAAVILPGGVLGVRISIQEYHQTAATGATLAFVFRSLSSVNYKRGVSATEVEVEMTYLGTNNDEVEYHAVTLDDLSDLGDPAFDREVEFSVWLCSDVGSVDKLRLLDVEILPRLFTAKARQATTRDIGTPQLSAREVKGGLGTFSGQLAAKIREIYNGLNHSLWGTSPGLLPNLQLDRRRRFRESIIECHGHQGVLTPDFFGGLYSDGACLKDAQSFGYLTYLGEVVPFPLDAPPAMDTRPNQGSFLHFTDDLSVGWMHYGFRRSIPAGLGELCFRLGAHRGTQDSLAFDMTQTLLMSISITLVGGGSDIVTRLSSGPYVSPLDPTQEDYGFVEVAHQEDDAFLSNQSLLDAGLKGWNGGAEKTATELEAAQMNSKVYRVSELIRAQITYPVSRPGEVYHATGDYDVRIRFKMRSVATGLCDDEAGILWLLCYSAPGY